MKPLWRSRLDLKPLNHAVVCADLRRVTTHLIPRMFNPRGTVMAPLVVRLTRCPMLARHPTAVCACCVCVLHACMCLRTLLMHPSLRVCVSTCPVYTVCVFTWCSLGCVRVISLLHKMPASPPRLYLGLYLRVAGLPSSAPPPLCALIGAAREQDFLNIIFRKSCKNYE